MTGVPWGLVLAAFMLVAWGATRMAWRLESQAAQYLGLATYVVAKGLILVPLLYRAEQVADGLIAQAAQVTLLGALGLTLVAFTVRTDFSGLRPYLAWGGVVAFVLIVAALVFGLRLGTWFSVGMIALSGGSILYDTAKIARRYRGRRHVAAALSLFASVGMMFWYVLRLFTRFSRR
jgi:FtsH-binding integral membrane protein